MVTGAVNPDTPTEGLDIGDEATRSTEFHAETPTGKQRNGPLGRLAAILRSTWLQRVVLIASALALVLTAVRRWDDIALAIDDIGLAGLAIATLAALTSLGCQWRAWHVLMHGFGSALPRRRSGQIYGLSVMGKYLPGGVWSTMLQVELSATAGMRRWATFAASATAMIVTVVVGGTVGLLAVPQLLDDVDSSTWLWLGLLIPLVVLLHPRVLNALVARSVRSSGSDQVRQVSGKVIIQSIVWTLASWLFLGAQITVLSQGDGRIPLPEATAGFALAWTLGFLFLIAPAGVGIRDLVLVGVLSTHMDRDAAIAVALISRAVLTFVDLAVGGVSALSIRTGRSTSNHSEQATVT